MNSNLTYSPETPNLGQIRRFFEPCELEIWRMTFKNNRAPLLSIIKLCASFHCHMWIQTGVIVRKRRSGVMTSVTLTFALWPWPFAWTSLPSMVIITENFTMIRWQGVSEWFSLTAFLRTADIEVHIVHTSRVVIAYTLKSLSSLT